MKRDSLIFVESMGEGDPLVLVHGWGMHGGLMRELAIELCNDFQVFVVDLPGHGRSEPLPLFPLQEVLERLKTSLPKRAHWVGWSLGGLIVLAIASRNPGVVRSISLIASSPRFVEDDAWPGVKKELLDQMGQDFVADYGATLSRFVGLQTFGHEGARQLSRRILSLMAQAPPPDVDSLLGALNLLRDLDLREEFTALSQPILSIWGGRDRLVPSAQSIELERLCSASISAILIDNAAHLPFVTHSQEVLAALREFLLPASR